MGDKRAIVQFKAKVLKNHISELGDMLSVEVVDNAEVTARFDDLSTSFRKYEDTYESLCILEKNDQDFAEWNEVRKLYYPIAGKIAKIKVSETSLINDSSNPGTPNANSTISERQKLPILPLADIPKFDGVYTEWLSFKNSFLSIVDAQSVDDVVKLLHLRTALQEEYERKRILASNHLNSIIDIAPLRASSPKEISRLVDDVKQHLAMLESLQIRVDGAIVLCILERALTPDIRQKWDQSLGLDEIPDLAKFYKVMKEIAYRIRTSETSVSQKIDSIGVKRTAENFRLSKFHKGNDNVRALVTNVSKPCVCCNAPHALYQCQEFRDLIVSDRWNFVKMNKLCFNCLRRHDGKCVDSQSVDDVVKLLHLRTALQGEAFNKIRLFDVRGENYAKAWQTLTEEYERKRILASNHLNAIIDITPLRASSPKEISRLVDDVKQHLAMLESLQIRVDGAIVLCILERALTPDIRQKWDQSLGLDEIPDLAKFYKVMKEIAYRIRTSETSVSQKIDSVGVKRTAENFRLAKFHKDLRIDPIFDECPESKLFPICKALLHRPPLSEVIRAWLNVV
ncbi:hypothetical protein TSAR_006916 [Trichomalopsis sarcophagae]|uniref:Uncharacterized protein n=1 Tax=Trichomalopsis sarcophagae TaxID=543379 RepID=A0A232ED35_9HYME|nr:hypothetical protein TSAR_006916 [Trichomalopsis sarcophagae]